MDLQSVIKQIGRGKLYARHLETSEARQLYRAMLNDEIELWSLGTTLYEKRGEGETDMLGFSQALQERLPHWPAPQGKLSPIVIPSNNGARRQANLERLLQRCGLGYLFILSITMRRELAVPRSSALMVQRRQPTLSKRGISYSAASCIG